MLNALIRVIVVDNTPDWTPHLFQVVLKTICAIAPEDEPKFNASESSAKGYLPVAIVDDRSTISFFRFQESLDLLASNVLIWITDWSHV